MVPSLYPLYVDVSGREVLVVGGGAVAARKVLGLRDSGARITVVAPRACPAMDEAARDARANVLRRPYCAADMRDKWLAIAATDDPDLSRAVADDAAGARVFCNVVDRPDLCSFQVPATLRRGLLQVAVSTGGASPALARRIRKQLEAAYGEAYGPLLDAMTELRRHFRDKYPDDRDRRKQLLESFLDSPAPDLLLKDGDLEAFRSAVEQWRSR